MRKVDDRERTALTTDDSRATAFATPRRSRRPAADLRWTSWAGAAALLGLAVCNQVAAEEYKDLVEQVEQTYEAESKPLCKLTSYTEKSHSIELSYDVRSCPSLTKDNDHDLFKACLKKRNSWVRICHGGQVAKGKDSEGTVTFTGLVSDTNYKIKLFYAKGKKDLEKFRRYKRFDTQRLETN